MAKQDYYLCPMDVLDGVGLEIRRIREADNLLLNITRYYEIYICISSFFFLLTGIRGLSSNQSLHTKSKFKIILCLG